MCDTCYNCKMREITLDLEIKIEIKLLKIKNNVIFNVAVNFVKQCTEDLF